MRSLLSVPAVAVSAVFVVFVLLPLLAAFVEGLGL